MLEVLPLSPVRECAISRSLHGRQASSMVTAVRTAVSGMSAEATAITCRADFHAPPPAAGPLV